MKRFNNSVLRSILAVILGLVLILWPESVIHYLVMLIGIFFIIPGIISFINYFTYDELQNNGRKKLFPIDGIGSLLLGGWLVIMPGFFVNTMMYLLGAVLIIAGVQQIITLAKARNWSSVPVSFYILPTLILVTGCMIIYNPASIAANTFVIFGIAIMIYGVTEFINWYKFRKRDYIQID